MAARDLANDGFKVIVIERNNYIGGGFWIGQSLMNKVTVRGPAQEVLMELNLPFNEVKKGLYLTDGPHPASKLIAHACVNAGVKFLNMTVFEDVVIREKSVAGAVINWTPIEAFTKTDYLC